MKTTVNLYDFRKAFHDMGRGNQFSYDGLRVLYNSLEELSDDTGEEYELDVIALCCEFEEATPDGIAAMYNLEWITQEEDDDEGKIKEIIEFLCDVTFVCGATDKGTIVYQPF